MRLVELTERSSSILMVRRARKNGFPCINRFRRGESHDQVVAAFESYGQLSQVTVRTMTAISGLSSMHEDICHVAEGKRVAVIILPFHKQWTGGGGGGDDEVENVGHGWSGVNQRVLRNAPCSVAVHFDRGFRVGVQQIANVPVQQIANVLKRVCILFFGGPDNREALALGGRMAEHPAVKVTVVRFVMPLPTSPEKCAEKNYREKEADEAAVAEFQSRWEGTAEYVEKEARKIAEGALAIGMSEQYELVVVGRGRFPPEMIAELGNRHTEHEELGPIGDLLASSGQHIVTSVLVIQQHDLADADGACVSKKDSCKGDSITADGSSV